MMEPATTQHQFFIFLELFGQFTTTIASALYYAGIFAGFIVFPIYAVVLLRRRTQQYMDRTLDEISERDPWLLAASMGQGVFDSQLPFRWLEDLCAWHARYRGIGKLFGSPDLEAKCMQVTKALLAVFLSWAPEIRQLDDARRERLTDLLSRLRKHSSAPAIERLLKHLSGADDPLAWIRPLQATASATQSWSLFLQRTGIPLHLTPVQAAGQEDLTRERLALALLLFARTDFPYREKIREYLVAAHNRAGQDVRLNAVLVDRFLDDSGTLMKALRDIVARVPDDWDTKVHHPAWKKFVLAFGRTPLEVIDAAPGDTFIDIKRKFRQRVSRIHAGEGMEAFEEAKVVDLAWQVVLALRSDGLIK